MPEYSPDDVDSRMAKDLFAPLFWRLPVEAVQKAMVHRYSGRTLSLAGYRLLANGVLGLRFEPYRTALADGQELMNRFGRDESDEWPIGWQSRIQNLLADQLQLSDEPSPALVRREELLGEPPYWTKPLDEAREALGERGREPLTSSPSLRRHLQAIADRRELTIQGLLGEYGADFRITIYPAVIEAAGELLGLTARYLKSVVFIHLSTRALAHQARDLDDQPGYGFSPTLQTGPFEQESPVHVSLVQVFAHRLIRRLEDANLLAAFEKLSQYQPEPYRRWKVMQETPLETLRQLLLRARVSASSVALPESESSG